MQPLPKQVKKGALIAGSTSMTMRLPNCSITGEGKVTRSIFFGCPSGSTSTAATTGCPASVRASVPVKQTCLELASGLLSQNLAQGENTSLGISAGAAPDAPGAGAACAAGGACWAAGDAGRGAAGFAGAAGRGGLAGAGWARTGPPETSTNIRTAKQ